MKDIFKNLFILDMANNHQGNLSHGLNIIDKFAKVIKNTGIKAGIKFQYRQLDTFIHPKFKNSTENKHIPRFLSTRLKPEDYLKLVKRVKSHGLVSICTPFDEESVDVILKHGIDVIKIASCSAQDWPLLERIAQTGKPVICSTGGLTKSQIDNLVSFFNHNHTEFALMHCVALYPTHNNYMSMDRISYLRQRYPETPIGFSTHEEPTNLLPIGLAVAKGAKLFERHIGVETEKIKLNAYSSTPEQVEKWINACKEAQSACVWGITPKEEIDSLNSLKRGVYCKVNIKNGEPITEDKVFFAMPLQKGQMESGEFKTFLLDVAGKPRKQLTAERDCKANEPLDKIEYDKVNSKAFEIIHDVKGMLNEAKIHLNNDVKVELSHHYGVENIDKFGAVLITVINREYCKKLIAQSAGQTHPLHFHRKKEETFHVLFGTVTMLYGKDEYDLKAGDVFVVKRNVPHGFKTNTGVIFEEVSTTHFVNDSFYVDSSIYNNKRKTDFELW
jgi:N-acetylneuraminate synthase